MRTQRPSPSGGSLRLPVITRAPEATKRSATASPIPELAPVTPTAAPFNETIDSSPFIGRCHSLRQPA